MVTNRYGTPLMMLQIHPKRTIIILIMDASRTENRLKANPLPNGVSFSIENEDLSMSSYMTYEQIHYFIRYLSACIETRGLWEESVH
jgi:hypothetical protein